MISSPIEPFKLESYFRRYEFNTELLLCSSDVEGFPVRALLAGADDEMLALWEGMSLGYTESPGHPLLRREIKKLYDHITDDDIIVTTSGEEPIYITMRLLLKPGDHAIVVWPGYQSHSEIANSIGADVTLLPVRPMGHRWRNSKHWMIDLSELKSALRHNTKLLVTNFPHNPTGAQPTPAEFAELAEFVREAGIHWLSDEVYRGLEYLPADKLPAAADLAAGAISIGALSKTYAMAGLRIGWAATRDARFREQMLAYKDYTTICNSAPSEILAIMALRARERVAARSLNIVKTNLALAGAFFKRHEDMFEWTPPSAGSVGFVRLKHGDADEFADGLVKTQSTLLLPASVFGYPYPYFRIGLGRHNFPEALARLETYLATRP